MSDKTCSTCKHWGGRYSIFAHLSPPMPMMGECVNVSGKGLAGFDIRLDPDGREGGDADVVVTGPDFGCIYYET